ncbi:MAG: ATP-binding protein [Deinococcales bacterium]
MTLLVDIGTNAEIVLGNRERLAACSSPTGPALEGAQISSGQRAAAGAIERVRIDKTTLEPSFKIIGCDTWSHEASFAQDSAELSISGICGSGIIEVLAEMYLANIITPDGQINGELKHPRISQDGRVFRYLLYDGSFKESDVNIYITQQDVRAIQLAKAALYAGVKLLMDHLGITEVDNIALAGAFGSHIDTKYAMILGLIPDCDLSKVRSAGNAAGDGALRALLSKQARRDIEEVVAQVHKIETAVEPNFQSYFVDALAFPNKRDSFPKLEAALGFNLPKASEATPVESGRQRRRARTV